MRITLTVASLAPEYGGPAGKALSLASALNDLGHEASVVSCEGTSGEATRLRTFGRFHGTPVPRELRPLVRAVRDCDVLHVLGFRDPVGTAAALVGRALHIPYLLEPAGMLQPRLRSFRAKRAFDAFPGQAVVGGARLVVATSRAEAAEVAAAGVAPSKVRLRFNGVQLSGLFPLPERGRLRGRLGIPPDVPLLLTVGRIAAIKGLRHMAQAVARVDGIFWLVAGPDEGDGTLPALQRSIRELGIADRTMLVTDGLWGGEKAEALADADAFCMASENESFGSAAAEAACAGLPVAIAVNCGVLDCLAPETVRTFRYGDIDGLVAALRWALRDPSARTSASASADGLRLDLDWTAVVLQQVAIYDEAQSALRT